MWIAILTTGLVCVFYTTLVSKNRVGHDWLYILFISYDRTIYEWLPLSITITLVSTPTGDLAVVLKI